MLIGIVPGAGGICEGGPPALGKLPIHGEDGIAVVQLTSRENDINAKMKTGNFKKGNMMDLKVENMRTTINV
jgi:hypothetical protein